jgi:hypothetical protein
LTFQDERDRDRRRKSDQGPNSGTADAPPSRKRKSPPTEVGDALRSVYQRAVNEDIPPRCSTFSASSADMRPRGRQAFEL